MRLRTAAILASMAAMLGGCNLFGPAEQTSPKPELDGGTRDVTVTDMPDLRATDATLDPPADSGVTDLEDSPDFGMPDVADTGSDVGSDADMPTCGDGLAEGTEACDGADFREGACSDLGFDGGELACNATCTAVIATGCTTCGNNLLEGSEVCDGADLAGQMCTNVGFTGGVLGCTDDCLAFATTQCTMCGNGTVEPGELCEDGKLGGETCVSRGYDNGLLGCALSCLDYDESDCTHDLMCVLTPPDASSPCTIDDAVTCECVGCVDDGSCELDDDCVCDDCVGSGDCDGADCDNNGACDVWYESCECPDCFAHPSCL